MLFVVSGAILVAVPSASFWYLLPRNGVVNPMVRNSDVGSMVTIGIMGVMSLGIALLFDGLFG
jgi:hypothetical protein